MRFTSSALSVDWSMPRAKALLSGGGPPAQQLGPQGIWSSYCSVLSPYWCAVVTVFHRSFFMMVDESILWWLLSIY
jgi:hypothetical protein